jgi:hypothetical protein
LDHEFNALVRQPGGWIGLDGVDNAVYVLDDSLGIVSRIGRRGNGPAEFKEITRLLPVARTDQVVIWDRRARSVRMVTDGVLDSAAHVLPASLPAPRLEAWSDHGVMLVTSGAESVPGEGRPTRRLALRIALDGSVLDTIAVLSQSPTLFVSGRSRDRTMQFDVAQPFTAADNVFLTGSGHAGVVRGATALVVCCADNGMRDTARLERHGTGAITDGDREETFNRIPVLRSVAGDSLWPREKWILANEAPIVSDGGDAVWVRLTTDRDRDESVVARIVIGSEPMYYRISGQGWRLLWAESSRALVTRTRDDGAQVIAGFAVAP